MVAALLPAIFAAIILGSVALGGGPHPGERVGEPPPGHPQPTSQTEAGQPKPASADHVQPRVSASRPTEQVDSDKTRPDGAATRPGEESAKTRKRGKDPAPPREPSAEAILRELTKLQNRSGAPVTRPQAPGVVEQRTVSTEAVPSNAYPLPESRLLPDGYRIVDRPGRLTREGDYWVLAFESRGEAAPELPIRLLPNRLLEDMEMFSSGGTKAVVFLVSGEVTEYHNVNYLLVQKLLTRVDLGNLK